VPVGYDNPPSRQRRQQAVAADPYAVYA